MDIGITSFFGFKTDIESRIKIISEAGFDRVMCCTDPRYEKQNGRLYRQVRLIKKYGMKLTSLHARYIDGEMQHFFMEDKIGDKYLNDLKKDVLLCEKYNFDSLVIHFEGMPSEIGRKRFASLVKFAERHNVKIAVENLNNYEVFTFLLDNFKQKNVGFCYDIGHRNIFMRDFDILKKYGKRLFALHLHNNDGYTDLHTLKCLLDTRDIHYKANWGNNYHPTKEERKFINWQEFAEFIAVNNIKISLDYELNNNIEEINDYTQQEITKMCHSEAVRLREMINSLKGDKND